MANNHLTSKPARQELYNFVEELLGRKMLDHEQIKLSHLTRKAVKAQMTALLEEHQKMQKSLASMRYTYTELKKAKKIIDKYKYANLHKM